MTEYTTTPAKTSDLITKVFDGYDVRIIQGHDNEPWFFATDICHVLDLTNPSQVVRGRMRKNADGRRYRSGGLDDDEWATVDDVTTNSTHRSDLLLVDEFGVYGLILKSQKEGAKRMKRWIKHEVLPSLFRTGSYRMQEQSTSINTDLQQTLQVIAQGTAQLQQMQAQMQQQVQETRQLAEQTKKDVEDKLQHRQLSEDLRQRSCESMRDEINRLARSQGDSYGRVYNELYDEVADYDGVDFRRKYPKSERGSKSVLQMLDTYEMGLVLDSARYLFDA